MHFFSDKFKWMVRYTILVGLIIFIGLQSSCQKTGIVKDWELVWQENFGQDHFDEAVWSKIPRGTPDWKNYMSDFDSCFAMLNGNLVLRGIRNKEEYGLNDTARFLTGGVFSKDKKSFQRSRLEVKVKILGARGAWPAVWLLPQNGKWPDGGEIDIMERLNSESIAYQTVHSNYTVNLKQTNPPKGGTGRIDADGYNVYAVELGQDSLRFFINDTHTFTYPRINTDKDGQFPFDQLYYLLIDMQLGGSWVGPVNPNDLPAEMWVDWVRFYKKN